MRKIQNKDLAELLMQLRFTPEKKRLRQLEAAEALAAIVEKDKQYPFEFVFFRITGFHPKGPSRQPLMSGSQLLSDLGVFIAKLSSQLAIPAAGQGERVFDVEQLARTLGVSSKTIARWRQRGLIARKFVFEDGGKRLGFLESRVDEFLRANPDLCARARGFSRMTEAQRNSMIRRAAALAAKSNLTRHQVIVKVAAEFGRSRETVRSALVNYEKAHPDKPLFKRPPGVTSQAQAAEIHRLFKEGWSARDLAKRFGRSRSSIYRIINTRRARELLRRKIEFIPSDEFLLPDARERILGAEPAGAPQATGPIPAFVPTTASLSDYLGAIKKAPALNREQELDLFRRYNYLKYLACAERGKIKAALASGRLAQRIEGYIARAEQIRQTIIEANLHLVVTIARRHASGGASLPELISEGNVALMRAVEKYDYSRGFRFATFASWTIAKDFARKMPARAARRDREAAASLAKMQQGLGEQEAEDLAAIERAHQSLAQVIKDELTAREQYVILNRFGPIGQPIKKKTKTLKEIGQDLGLTKERVRQIELQALQKLRQSLGPKEFELLTR